ncbi:hypothetical protein LMQ74_000011 [Listeria monocytogenes]|uniref:hypothetical protein n=1 Tax=Listeria monocytogenes TaxID=1639 RepID=UPI0010E5C2FA|nr:hypothetical protein [Listeria monocytogenes]EAD2655812.1 hypothetical protein [Listeria monocytogenes]EIM0412970.1 hypothetical protein [Listeria monocytogenes]EIM0799657.1 hypothetical protein [Listeria monocytogenes]EIM1267569.1 hypothetical protein [Listeria monocytogenes]TYU88642.1 hypothetical protein FZX01_03780 [Listeria monocytogenes]
MNEYPIVYEPWYMVIYLLVIIGIFSAALVLSLEKYKFSIVGKALIGMCFVSLGVLFIYVLMTGYVSDIKGLIFDTIGVLDVLLFTHPYLFLILAILLGGEKRPPHVSKIIKK